MFGPRFLIINKKFLLGLVIILALGLAYPVFKNNGPDLPPHDMIAKVLENSSQAQSYRYQTEAQILVKGNKEILSKVEGEKSGSTRIHVKGSIMKSTIELFQINDKTYTKDSFTNRWIVLEGNSLQQQELFMTELNPLANFAYKELFEAKYNGIEEVKGQKTWAYSLQPQVTSTFLDMFWTHITFKMWVGTKDHLLKKAILQAESKKDRKDTLQITIFMYDYNKPIEINPPKVKPLGQP